MSITHPRKVTPIEMNTDFAQLLSIVFQQLYGRQPYREEAEWLSALFAAENAKGRAVLNYNWGNVAANPAKSDHWIPDWADYSIPSEALSKASRFTRERMERGEPVPRAFRANSSHEEGARIFLRLFQAPTHERIIEAARKDDLDAFWKGISTPHPQTKMRYCIECHTQKHKAAYKSHHDEIVRSGIFARLPKVGAPVEAQ